MDNQRDDAAVCGAIISAGNMSTRILILGGTAEARLLAQRLAARPEFEVTLSLAGRTQAPLVQPVPVRSGGFGGVEGLARHLQEHRVDALIDATHPYAPRITANAVAAAAQARVPMIVLGRPAWQPVTGDRWIEVADTDEALQVLGREPRKLFLALGRQEIEGFERAPWHHYLIRSVDPVDPPLALPSVEYLLARGPFDEAEERALLLRHGIEFVVAKNSGGSATYGKIAAARALGLTVLLFRRPPEAPCRRVATVGEAIAWLDAHAAGGALERGV